MARIPELAGASIRGGIDYKGVGARKVKYGYRDIGNSRANNRKAPNRSK